MNTYEMITKQIIEKIENAEKTGEPFHWIRPWSGGAKLPESYTTQKKYAGVNFLNLDPGQYITYKGLLDYKATLPEEEAEKIHIKKGCHKVPIYYFGTTDKKDEQGNVVQKVNSDGTVENEQIWFMRYYQAFNIEDIANLPSRYPADKLEHTPTENSQKLDEYIAAYARAENLTMDIVPDGSKCFYRPSCHMVRVPERSGFVSLYSYYSGVLHEIVHSTMKGLAREAGANFGSTAYSREELIAQIGSCMLCNIFGIVADNDKDETNDINYLRGWASYLKENSTTEITRASSQAQKAAQYFVDVAEKQLMKERFAGLQDIALQYKDGYLFVQEAATGDYFDYTIFNNEMIITDGGQFKKSSEIPDLKAAVEDILNGCGLTMNAVSIMSRPDKEHLVYSGNHIPVVER